MKPNYTKIFKQHIEITQMTSTAKQHYYMCFTKNGNLFFVNANIFEELVNVEPDEQSYILSIIASDEDGYCLGSATASLAKRNAESLELQKQCCENVRIPQRALYLDTIATNANYTHHGLGQTLLKVLLYEGKQLKADHIHGYFYPHDSLNAFNPNDQRFLKLFYKQHGILVTAIPKEKELVNNRLFGNLHNLAQQQLQENFQTHLCVGANKQCHIVDLFGSSNLTDAEKQTILHNVETWLKTQQPISPIITHNR